VLAHPSIKDREDGGLIHMAGPRWRLYEDAAALIEAAVADVRHAAAEATARCGEFHIVLAGGNTPREVYRRLRHLRTDWTAWRIYFGDERCLPAGDPHRNSRMAADAWLSHVALPPHCLHVIPAETGAEAAAEAYGTMLRGVGTFDLVLLGLGEDGHTASLFPGHPWEGASANTDVIAVHDAPKPPPDRVSLAAGRLSRARRVLFLVTGIGKRAAVAAWRAGEAIPAAAVRPEAGVEVLVERPSLPD
jgi:6-phosphogluconolactonase